MKMADLDTPVLVVDLDRMERNIQRMAGFAREAGVKLRPHVKTHKIPHLAHLQLNAGAAGITVAKVGEAEVMAEAGISDILVCYPVLGQEKLRRLAELARRCRITVALDSAEVAAGLSDAAQAHNVSFEVYLEVDSGLGRCGLPPGEPVVDLARRIWGLPGITVTGVCTHAGHALRAASSEERDAIGRCEADSVLQTKDRLEKAGMPVREVSVGSSATVRVSGRVPGVTEIRPGTYIFNDYAQVMAGAATQDDCALEVLSTVVSRPSADRAVLDAGSKCLSSDFYRIRAGMDGYGYLRGHGGLTLARLSEEHGVVPLQGNGEGLRIGDRVQIIPNHACAALNLFDVLIGVRRGDVQAEWPVLARGQVR